MQTYYSQRIPKEKCNKQQEKNMFYHAIPEIMQDDGDTRVTELTDQTFDEFIKTHKFVVIDFWAEWCAPCLILSPVIDQLAEEISSVSFGKLDSQNNENIANKYSVMSLPTIMFFKEGKEVDQVIGVTSKGNLERWIKKNAM